MSQSQATGFLGKLKGLVIEEVPEAAQAPVKHTRTPTSVQTTASIPEVATADPQVRKVLEKDVGLAAQPAYSQFLSLADSMASIISDEPTRLKASLAALAPQGFTLASVLTDIDECLAVLDKKEREAQSASAAVRDGQINVRLKEISALDERIAAMRAQIDTLLEKRELIGKEVEAEERRIAQSEARFKSTVDAFRQELADRKNQLKNL